MKKIYLLLLLIIGSMGTVHALEPFTISDIRVEGLQRITEGTVFNYLPIEIGDVLTPGMSKIAIRELYRTGFFEDISLARESDILVISVSERPSIARIVLTGNKAIKSEDLLGALADIGLAEGEIFNRVELDRMQQELVKQYYSQGKYAVQVDTSVLNLERNRVRVSIIIDEGDNAKIKHINIVGNTLFTDEELREEFESDIPSKYIFWSKDDQYSREKLSGDLEKLRSYYQDRGYVDFNVESTQVSISPDKSSIYITANVREGELFNIGDIEITGDLVIDESSLRRLIYTNTGRYFRARSWKQASNPLRQY
jgi:outer membrane protein insertion porin family